MLSHLVPVALGGEAEPTPDEIAAWLDTLPAHDAAASARLLVEKLVVLNRAPAAPRSRPRVLDMLRARADRVRPRLESELAGATLPLPPRVRETAHLLEKLLKELASGYLAVVLATPRPWLTLGLKRQPHAAVVTAMELLGARLALSDRLHARAPARAWQDLHRLYRHARELGVHGRRTDGSVSPEAVYVRALLLAFAEPSRLMPGEHERLRDYVAAFGHLATVVEPPVRGDGRCAFLLDLRRDKPGTAFARRVETPPAGDRLVLQTRPLVEQAYVHMARLRAGVSPATLGLPEDAIAAGYPALLAKVGRSWRGERRRRSPRLAFRPRVRLSVGFEPAWRMLAGCDEGSTGTACEWTILNESADGFALRLARGASAPVAVGDVVLAHSRERDQRYLCVVRRVQSDAPEHLEIGVQQVLPAAEAVHWEPEVAGEGATPVFFSAAGEARGAHARVLVPGGRASAQTLLVLERRGRLMSLQVRRFVERGRIADVVEVERA